MAVFVNMNGANNVRICIPSKSGGSLPIKVAFSSVKPNNPALNTVWIASNGNVTTGAIYIQSEEPASPSANDVWVNTTVFLDCFNVPIGNLRLTLSESNPEAVLYVRDVRVYNGSAWIIKGYNECAIYNGTAWLESSQFLIDGSWINPNNNLDVSYKDSTVGYTIDNGDIKCNTNWDIWRVGNYNGTQVSLIDLTPYSKLVYCLSSNVASQYAMPCYSNTVTSLAADFTNFTLPIAFSSSSRPPYRITVNQLERVQVDISSFNGSYVVGSKPYSSSKTMIINNLILVP